MTKTIHQAAYFNATPQEVFELIMDAKKHAGFTGAPAKISRKIGDSFSVWDGYATGRNIEIKIDKKIVQTWRASDWPKGVESTVTFEFEPKNNGCELHFMQTGVPEEFFSDIEQGWKDNYWSLMKDYLDK